MISSTECPGCKRMFAEGGYSWDYIEMFHQCFHANMQSDTVQTLRQEYLLYTNRNVLGDAID